MFDFYELAKKKLDLSDKTISLAKEIVSRFKKGKSDEAGVVASAVYLAGRITGENRSQATVAEALGTTEMTMRTNIYRRGMLKIAVALSESESH